MAVLKYLEQINQSIQNAHQNWLTKNLSSVDEESSTVSHNRFHNRFSRLLKGTIPYSTGPLDSQYSILNYPDTWSGFRITETAIQQKNKFGQSAFDAMPKFLKLAKRHFKKDSSTLKKIEIFDKNYQKYFNSLKEISLLESIFATKNIIHTKHSIDIKLDEHFFINLHTHHDCLIANNKIHEISMDLKKKNVNENLILQFDTLAKRFLDIQYEKIKKQTTLEFFANKISSLTIAISLMAGIPAALLGIGAFFFQPLLLPVIILGSISYISYVASGILANKVLYEWLLYHKAPSFKDLNSLVIDILLSPFMLANGKIAHGLIKSFPQFKNVFKFIKYLWGNEFSNIFPDVLSLKDTVKDMRYTISNWRYKNKLASTFGAYSGKIIPSLLTAHANEANSSDKINKTIQLIEQAKASKKLNDTTLFDRNFVLLNFSTRTNLSYVNSYHGHILLFQNVLSGSKKADNVNTAVKNYLSLKPDDTINTRKEKVSAIQFATSDYLLFTQKSSKQYQKAKDFQDKVLKELTNLEKLDSKAKVALIGRKVSI